MARRTGCQWQNLFLAKTALAGENEDTPHPGAHLAAWTKLVTASVSNTGSVTPSGGYVSWLLCGRGPHCLWAPSGGGGGGGGGWGGLAWAWGPKPSLQNKIDEVVCVRFLDQRDLGFKA